VDVDAERWDQRYESAPQVAARAPEVVALWPAVDTLLPTSGRCVDVASGPGGVTLWLAERGLDVTALDVSGVAIRLLDAAATTSELAGRVDARAVDLDDGLPDDLHDVDLIVCQRFRDPLLYPTMIDRLRIGGLAVVTVLSSVGADDPGPFHAPAGELRAAFTNARCEILYDHEADGLAHVVVRRP
jgi:SAM-dependent methyltransferase